MSTPATFPFEQHPAVVVVVLNHTLLHVLFHMVRVHVEPYTDWGLAREEELVQCATLKPATRWGRALLSGHQWLMQQQAVVWVPGAGLLLPSQSRAQDGVWYWATGYTCECEAFDYGIAYRGKPWPCDHRAIARLVDIHMLCLPHWLHDSATPAGEAAGVANGAVRERPATTTS